VKFSHNLSSNPLKGQCHEIITVFQLYKFLSPNFPFNFNEPLEILKGPSFKIRFAGKMIAIVRVYILKMYNEGF
jgi:hypothetical protein